MNELQSVFVKKVEEGFGRRGWTAPSAQEIREKSTWSRVTALGVMSWLVLTIFSQAAFAEPQVVSTKKIWDAGGHNAFTDLIRFKDEWFCVFREAEAHKKGNGSIRVLASKDGEQWTSAALISETGIDLRDPKLSTTPDNRLMVVLGGSVYEGPVLKEKQPRVTFSKDGHTWESPKRVLFKDDWLWRVTWYKGHAYGIVYGGLPKRQPGAPTVGWTIRLVEAENGIDFHDVAKLNVPGSPNESTVRFSDNGNCIALVRRETSDRSAWIGTSAPPYKEWEWKPAGMFIGGPNFIFLPDGSMIAGGRQTNSPPAGPKTFLGKMDLQSVTPQLVLPSGGDCSYPGLVWHDGLLWVSYYSSHEGKTSIYLAKVKL